MSILQNIISLMRGYRSDAYKSKKITKIKFGVPLSKLSQKSCSHLPKPLFDLLVYLAQEGVKTNDLFRRPGNSIQIKEIIEHLSSGKEINWESYNLYTAANVVKKYFISLPGGIFGRKFETLLLDSYSAGEDVRRSTFHRILRQLPNANREMAILMFGILFRMVSHAVDSHNSLSSTSSSSNNGNNSANGRNSTGEAPSVTCSRLIRADTEQILAEAVAKSVAGSMFHLCTTSPDNVERAAKVLKGLILDFPSFEESYVDFYYRSTMISYRNDYPNYFYSIVGNEKYLSSEFEEEHSFPSVTAIMAAAAAGKSGSDTIATVTLSKCGAASTQKNDLTTITSKPHDTIVTVPTFTLTNPHGDIIVKNTGSLKSSSSSSSESLPNDTALLQTHQSHHYHSIIEDDYYGDSFYDNISLGSSKSSGYDQVQERQLQRLRLRSDWFLQSSCNDLQDTSSTRHHYRYQHRFLSNTREPAASNNNNNNKNSTHRDNSQHATINTTSDRQHLFITTVTMATSGPDLLITDEDGDEIIHVDDVNTQQSKHHHHHHHNLHKSRLQQQQQQQQQQMSTTTKPETHLLMVPGQRYRHGNQTTSATSSSANISTCSGSSSFIYDIYDEDEIEEDDVHFSDYH